MKRILKYEIAISDDVQEIEIPLGADILKYGCQPSNSVGGFETLVVWVMTYTEMKETEKMKVRIVGTGHEFDFAYPFKHGLNYRDTIQMPSGLVWHIFCEFSSVRK